MADGPGSRRTPPTGRSTPSVSFRTLLVLSHGLVLILPLAALVGTGALARDLIDQRRIELARQAELTALMVEANLEGGLRAEPLRPVLAAAWERTSIGLRIVDTRGIVLATTGPRLGEDLSDRPEIIAALAGEQGIAMRRDVPLPPGKGTPKRQGRSSLRWLYAAVPVRDADGRIVGAALAMRPVREVVDAFEDMWGDLRAGAVVSLMCALAVAGGLSYVLSRSLAALNRASRAVAEGREADVLAGRSSRIREVREVAEDLARMAARLAEQGRRNREFAGHVAHEFRTPLTTLRGTVEVLRTDADMPVAQRERFLDNASVDLERLGRMVDGLLVLARAEAGGERAPVDLDELLDDLAPAWGLRREGAAGVVLGDATWIEVIARNLLDNARVHGGGATSLVAVQGDTAGFDVVDTGPGISPANLPKIWERFFTTGADRQGTGLGLAIVRAAVEAQGGTVGVESAPGRTVFRVRLQRG